MGATAGTGMGVQRFAEGGSTSSGVSTGATPRGINQSFFTLNPAAQRAAEQASLDALAVSNLGGGFGGINPAAIRADSRAFGIGPAAQSLQRDLAREQMQSQRQIYRPEYIDYGAGLGATPQARGYLSSIIGNDLPMTMYQNRMPTFTRSTMPRATSASYVIPYRTQSQIDAEARAREAQLRRDALVNSDDYKYYEKSLIRQNPEYWENQGTTPDPHSVMAHMAAMNQG